MPKKSKSGSSTKKAMSSIRKAFGNKKKSNKSGKVVKNTRPGKKKG